MLQEGSLENPIDTGIVCSKQSQKQREFQTDPQLGDKEMQNRAPRTARRAAGTQHRGWGQANAAHLGQAAKALTQPQHGGVRAPGAALTTGSPPALLLPRSPGRAGTGRACCQAARPYMRPEPLRYPPPGTEQRHNRSVGPNFSNRP